MIYPPEISSISFGHGIALHFYGLIIAFAIVLCIFVIGLICKNTKKSLSVDVIYDILPFVIIFSIIGARLYYVLLNFKYYFQHPKEIFMIWQGGLAIHGAILAGLLSVILILKIKKLQILPHLDIFACVLPLGQAIGRWGNYINQEAFGAPCNYFWCMYVERVFRPSKYIDFQYFHPTFLYESILDLLIFAALFFLILKYKNLKTGIITGLYVILYSGVRIFVEALRTDATAYVYSMPFPMFVSVIFLILGILFVVHIHRV